MTGQALVDEGIVNKLKKVLALTTSPIEGEAQAAAAKLQEMLSKHNLSMMDLEMRGKQETVQVGGKDHDLGKASFTWKLDLAEGIAKHYYCYPMVDRKEKTVRFIGRPDNVDSLKMLYQWLIDQIRRISSEDRKEWISLHNEHVDPLRWQVNFGKGAAQRLKERLDEKILRDAEASPETRALVVCLDSEISDFLEKQYGFRADGKRTAQQQKWDKEWADQQKAREELKATDIEEYYRQNPWDRPLTAEEQAIKYKEGLKAQKEWERKWARRSRREPSFRSISPEEHRKMEQGRKAKEAGNKAGNRINLEPFVENKRESRTEIG